MFDSYFGGPKSVYVNATTTEKKAPTDASAKLLSDLEKEAIDKLVARLSLNDNVCGEILVMRQPFNHVILLTFKLNGETYIIEVAENDFQLARALPHIHVQLLYQKIANQIAEAMLRKLAGLPEWRTF